MEDEGSYFQCFDHTKCWIATMFGYQPHFCQSDTMLGACYLLMLKWSRKFIKKIDEFQ